MINDSTIARMAGNIAASLVGEYSSIQTVASRSVEIARAIVALVESAPQGNQITPPQKSLHY